MQRVLKFMANGFLAALLLAPLGAQAQDAKAVPASRTEMQLSFAPLVKRTSGAVVTFMLSASSSAAPRPLPATRSLNSSSASNCRTARKSSLLWAPASSFRPVG